MSVSSIAQQAPPSAFAWEIATDPAQRERLWWKQFRANVERSLSNLYIQRRSLLDEACEHGWDHDIRLDTVERYIARETVQLFELDQRIAGLEARS